MEFAQSLEVAVEGMVTWAMLAPILTSIGLGIICVIWTKFN